MEEEAEQLLEVQTEEVEDEDSDEDVPFIVLKMKAQAARRRQSNSIPAIPNDNKSVAAPVSAPLQAEVVHGPVLEDAETVEAEHQQAEKKSAAGAKHTTFASKKAAAPKAAALKGLKEGDDVPKKQTATVVDSDSDDDVPLMPAVRLLQRAKEAASEEAAAQAESTDG